MVEAVWHPDEEVVVNSNLAKFMNVHGVDDYAALRSRALQDPAWYWSAVIQHFSIEFYEPYDQVMDNSDGKARTKWCVGGVTNLVLNCLDIQGDEDREVIVWEGETGETCSWTVRDLRNEVSDLAEGLRSLGVGRGDRVGIFMPMLPETAVAFFAIIKIGAIVVPLFSGFGPDAIRSRLVDSGAVSVITADGTPRRGRTIALKSTLDKAIATIPSLRHVIVLKRLNIGVAWHPDRDHWWHDIAMGDHGESPTERMEADAPFMLAYTSGTTGKPKGTVHTHCGFLTMMAADFGLCMDFKPDDRFLWLSDMGWLVGPITVVVSTFLGGTVIMAEGVPDYPDQGRLWRLVEEHRVSYLGVSPSLVRGMMKYGLEGVGERKFADLRITVSGGDPWTTDAWLWFFNHICNQRVPILNNNGGTEFGGPVITATVLHPLKPNTVGEPMPGIDADVVDEFGDPVAPGELGEFVVRQPLIGMTRGLWNDFERYMNTYWNVIPGLWVHGDWASIDEDGHWFIHGRSDDTIKLSGKRTGPAEIETLLIESTRVMDAAAVGIPDPVKGQALICACVPATDVNPDGELAEQLARAVAEGLGHAYRPQEVIFVSQLPKTQSMKTMRRVVRAVYTGDDPGDLSALVNPDAVAELRELLSEVSAEPKTRP